VSAYGDGTIDCVITINISFTGTALRVEGAVAAERAPFTLVEANGPGTVDTIATRAVIVGLTAHG
jgi:hypothetical protein